MTSPVVSVCIPTHDRPQLLREAIRSVLDNGFPDFEIIVSDDAPNGSGRAVVETLADPRVRYLRHPNPGTKAGNWDWALRSATGRYAFKLDDDDRILPGFLSQCIAILEQEPDVASVYTGHRILREGQDGAETVIDTTFFGATFRADGETYWRGVLANEGGYPRNQKTAGVFRREAAQRLDFYRHASEDFAFSAALGFFGCVAYLPEVLYEWRVHRGSGVRNLLRTWQLSDEACEGLRHLPAGIVPAAVQNHWRHCVDVTRRALPLFYLRAAFMEGGLREGWSFWNSLRRYGAAWSPMMILGLIAATVTPLWLRRSFFDWYQRSPALQRVVLACLRPR